jgi:hypothetical protein
MITGAEAVTHLAQVAIALAVIPGAHPRESRVGAQAIETKQQALLEGRSVEGFVGGVTGEGGLRDIGTENAISGTVYMRG